jgi:hypothetical protein
MLDPFRPENEDVERLKRLQAEVHDGFMTACNAAPAGSRGEDTNCSPASSGPAAAASSSGWRRPGRIAQHLQARYGAKVRICR